MERVPKTRRHPTVGVGSPVGETGVTVLWDRPGPTPRPVPPLASGPVTGPRPLAPVGPTRRLGPGRPGVREGVRGQARRESGLSGPAPREGPRRCRRHPVVDGEGPGAGGHVPAVHGRPRVVQTEVDVRRPVLRPGDGPTDSGGRVGGRRSGQVDGRVATRDRRPAVEVGGSSEVKKGRPPLGPESPRPDDPSEAEGNPRCPDGVDLVGPIEARRPLVRVPDDVGVDGTLDIFGFSVLCPDRPPSSPDLLNPVREWKVESTVVSPRR